MNFQANELTLHIALSALPPNGYQDFVQDMEEGFYKGYERRADILYQPDTDAAYSHNGEQVVYTPLKYFIFGNYDIAFVSLIDRFKFAQKLFAPEKDRAENPATFQIVTGVTLSPLQPVLKEQMAFLLHKDTKMHFIGIVNLKLTSGLLIGNGSWFLHPVVVRIRETMDEMRRDQPIKYFIQQSFSWFELSLVVFFDEPNFLPKVIQNIREWDVASLGLKDDISIRESLYFQELTGTKDRPLSPKKALERIMQTHVFADTQSYMGVNWDLFSNELSATTAGLRLSTEIEWMVKPGHLRKLQEVLGPDGMLKGIFDTGRSKLVLGKTDYFVPETQDLLANNAKLFRALHTSPSPLNENIRKVKTRVLFDQPDIPAPGADKVKGRKLGQKGDLYRQLSGLKLHNKEIRDINRKLKELKISRLMRSKVIKVFFNYNFGIQDPVLYYFFLDFPIFIMDIRNLIENEHQMLDVFKTESDAIAMNEGTEGGSDFEKALINLVEGFDECYRLRMLNSYQFEDLNDFDLDFNASIQQLLTSYNTLAIEVANLYYPAPYTQNRLVRLNFSNTVANYYIINYSVYHLMCPEFVFFTIGKEVLNYYYESPQGPSDKQRAKDRKQEVKDIKERLKKIFSSQHPLLADLVANGQVDFDYLFLDAVRFCTICRWDFELFSYWFWSYNAQNASLYDKYGAIIEKHFVTELVRLLLLSKIYKFPAESIECPLPEWQSLWHRYFYKLEREITACFRDTSAGGASPFMVEIRGFLANADFIIKGCYEHAQADVKPETVAWLSKQWNRTDKRLEEIISKRSYSLSFQTVIASGREGYVNQGETSFMLYDRSLDLFHKEQRGRIQSGEPVLFTKSEFPSPQLFIVGLMYSYLRVIYEKNHKKIHLLRRSSENGRALRCFLDKERVVDPGFLYHLDQTGGTFFSDRGSLNEYFKMRNGILQSLWHFASVQKKTIIEKVAEKFRHGPSIS